MLNASAREAIVSAVSALCERRGWRLEALHVGRTHMHVVVVAPKRRPEEVMRQMKSWGTRALRDGGLVRCEAGVRTRHGSTRYLWNSESVARACDYVMRMQ